MEMDENCSVSNKHQLSRKNKQFNVEGGLNWRLCIL